MKTATILFENNSFTTELNNDNLSFADSELVLGFVRETYWLIRKFSIS